MNEKEIFIKAEEWLRKWIGDSNNNSIETWDLVLDQ